MTPAARAAAAIAAFDRIAAGAPAEQVLTRWARGARYAGSKDRAAVRDLVFDGVRRWRSAAVRGGGESLGRGDGLGEGGEGDATGRARLLGLARQDGIDPDLLFTGEQYAPEALSETERAAGAAPTGAAARDLPDWLWHLFEADLGERAAPVAETLRHRAPVFLRVNPLRGDLPGSVRALEADGVAVEPVPAVPGALRVTAGPRRIAGGAAFRTGLVELQDAASQAVVAALPLTSGMTVLDYCAGGGGKALAMAGRMPGTAIDVHDADPRRMADLPARAARAGADLRRVAAPVRGYDLVLCDVPCSGSGAWRRAPEGKWRLTRSGLQALCATQGRILETCAGLVKPGGWLAYVTCSVLETENDAPVASFRASHPEWRINTRRAFLPGEDGDGLFVAVLTRGEG